LIECDSSISQIHSIRNPPVDFVSQYEIHLSISYLNTKSTCRFRTTPLQGHLPLPRRPSLVLTSSSPSIYNTSSRFSLNTTNSYRVIDLITIEDRDGSSIAEIEHRINIGAGGGHGNNPNSTNDMKLLTPGSPSVHEGWERWLFHTNRSHVIGRNRALLMILAGQFHFYRQAGCIEEKSGNMVRSNAKCEHTDPCNQVVLCVAHLVQFCILKIEMLVWYGM
jgi:hypothetical protein